MYKVTINTDSYKKQRHDKKNWNWKNDAMNDEMKALNGWNIIEPNLQCLKWRIEMFVETTENYNRDTVTEDYTLVYKEWIDNPKNSIEYLDTLCDVNVVGRVSCPEIYGFTQAQFDVSKVLEKLDKEDTIKIPFSWAYNTIQYIKKLDGCFMEITKL